jgi:YidC/Oxa1 family membrane protein insertase
MNNPKNLLLIALFFLGFLLYAQWQNDYGPKPVINDSTESQALTTQNNETSIPQQAINSNEDIPVVTTSNNSGVDSTLVDNNAVKPATRNTGTLITVTTNVLKLKIDSRGGSIVYAELIKFPLKKKSKDNIVLLNQTAEKAYFAQSGLLSSQAGFVHKDLYQAQRTNYEATDGIIEVPLTIEKNGIKVTKTYSFDANSYEIKLTDTIQNNSSVVWQGQQYRQLQRTNPWENHSPSFTDTDRMSFKGASYFEPEEGYVQLKFEDFIEDKINVSVQSSTWIAMDQHYFFSSFINDDKKTQIVSQYLANSQTPYIIRAISDLVQIQPNTSGEISTKLYIGPKIQSHLPQIAKGLDLTVDYGIFTVIAKPLFWVLNKIHSIVGNWGWSIILLTILIKLLFFKLTEKQYNSMARMRKLQPRIKTLKERHKENKQKFNEEMMALYKKEKVNPMGGCLPMLVQIPVFIALYWVLMESVELRQAPFMLWLQDLSSPDPYFILPAINAFAMFMTQKLSPTPGMDPIQAKIMKFMPLGFSVMFAFFQSGLVLYWAVNSSLSLLQQWIITKRIDAKG